MLYKGNNAGTSWYMKPAFKAREHRNRATSYHSKAATQVHRVIELGTLWSKKAIMWARYGT